MKCKMSKKVYSTYMKNLRENFQDLRPFYVQLPPTKTDCTCIIEGGSSRLSLMNAPASYCSACDNKGYIETKVEQKVEGTLVDFVADKLSFNTMLVGDGASEFDRQKYVIHASLVDCTAEDYDNQYCFDIAKEVRINHDYYKIQNIDKSTLLDQIKVVISKKN